ncbi:MAG: hypothetical protein WC282_04040, partial [Bacilli bacterium]
TFVNTITSVNAPTISANIDVTVSSARDSSTPTLSVTGQKLAYYRNETLDITGMIVKGDWDVGNDTFPTYSAGSSDSFFSVSPAPGTVLSTLGEQVVTVTYYVNSTSVSTTFTITIDNHIYTFFNHAFTDGTEWGATTTPVYGAITNREGTLTNSITNWSTSTTWILNTTVDNSNPDNGAFFANSDVNSNLLFLRFGTASAGPTTMSFYGKYFPAITNPENTLNGISRITLDAEAGAAGQLTVSVAGIAPTSYAINYGTPVSGSTATMQVDAVNGAYSSYTFYFPYTVIGRIRISYTNAVTPKFLDLGNFSVVGYNLDDLHQAEVFANMLNHTNTCSNANYENLKVVYDYLDSRNLTSYLADYSMDLQPAVDGQPTLNAAQLWAAYSSRSSQLAGQSVAISTTTNYTTLYTMLTIVFVSAVSLTAYFALEQRKKKVH